MNIGIFTDTYFPQVSGVATSIKTLKNELESNGHRVYIFTTSDPAAKEEANVFRFTSVPLLSFKERRIVVRGMFSSCQKARELNIDIIHTQTEFGMGLLGKRVGKKLGIPVIHTYHTMYEDYLHYIAKGKILKPKHVQFVSRSFTKEMSGIVCPSQRVVNKLEEYQIDVPLKIIPTGIKIDRFMPQPANETVNIREKYNLLDSDILLLSLSRISFEKNIQEMITEMPSVIKEFPMVKLLIVGDGPYMSNLKELVQINKIEEYVIFAGEIPNEEVGEFYRAADLFVNTSTSESQGLTYIEAIAAGAKVVAPSGPYLLDLIDNPVLGALYTKDSPFSETVIAYLKSEDYQIALDENNRNRKLIEISSDQFGKNVENFYYAVSDLEIKYDEKK